jgi:hypothetical protein
MEWKQHHPWVGEQFLGNTQNTTRKERNTTIKQRKLAELIPNIDDIRRHFLLLSMTIVGHDNSISCCVAAMALSKTCKNTTRKAANIIQQ